MNTKMVITLFIATLLFIIIVVGDLKMTNKTTNIENSGHFTKKSYQNSKLNIETTKGSSKVESKIIHSSSSSISEIIEPIRDSIITTDNSNTYEIELIDNYKNSFEKTSYKRYKGTILGNKFEIELPEYLIEMGHRVTLNIRNLKTGDFNRITANISGDKLEIDKTQLTNQQVYNDTIPQPITSGILPGVK